MRVCGVASQLGLKKKELNYFESKDILEHIIESVSRSPIMFLNAV